MSTIDPAYLVHGLQIVRMLDERHELYAAHHRADDEVSYRRACSDLGDWWERFVGVLEDEAEEARRSGRVWEEAASRPGWRHG